MITEYPSALTLQCLQQQPRPVVFRCGLLADWPAAQWTPASLRRTCGHRPTSVRFHKDTPDAVVWEADCEHQAATVAQFVDWLLHEPELRPPPSDGPTPEPQHPPPAGPQSEPDHTPDSAACAPQPHPLSPPSPDTEPPTKKRRSQPGAPALRERFPRGAWWGYMDYKHFEELFEGMGAEMEAATQFGALGADPAALRSRPTLWLGSRGCNTPCHYDAYGYNLVCQLYGRKRWWLFPPADTPFMYATRFPYEESSVYCPVHVPNPDLRRCAGHCARGTDGGRRVGVRLWDVLGRL